MGTSMCKVYLTGRGGDKWVPLNAVGNAGSYPGSAKSKMSAFVVEFRGPSNYGKAQVTYRVFALKSPGMNMQDTKCQEEIYHEVVRDLPQIFLTPMSKAFWLVLG